MNKEDAGLTRRTSTFVVFLYSWSSFFRGLPVFLVATIPSLEGRPRRHRVLHGLGARYKLLRPWGRQSWGPDQALPQGS